MFLNRLRKITIVLLLSIWLFACTSNSSTPVASDTNTNTSEKNNRSSQKVVALTSLAADIIYRLDKSKLVGISGSSILKDNPELAKIETVSQDRTQPNLEKIIALEPDLVIGASGFHDRVLEKLKKTGIETITYEIKSWNSLIEITETIARKIDADPQEILDKYQSFLEPIPSRTASVLVITSSQPIVSPNKDSWAGDLLTKFNLNNVAAELQGESPFQGYVNLSAEKILQANPDIIIAIDASEGTIDRLKKEPFWNKLNATQNSRVYTFPYYGAINPGSIAAIEEACNKLKQIKR